MTRYLTVAEVIELQDRTIERTGVRPEALRDEGLLESAMMRAQSAAYYEDADLVRQAVLMAVGVSKNKPFVDGNKRAAFVVLYGIRLDPTGYPPSLRHSPTVETLGYYP